MLRFLILWICIGLTIGSKPSQEAAIISESRYLNTAGNFGSSYSQEDGVEFKEEADSEGNRKGSYTYIDPNGIRRTLSYTAGKDGFQATGDHLPVAPPANFPIPSVPKLSLPVNYQTQSQIHNSQPIQSNSLQVQFQSLPVPGNPLLNLFQVQPLSVVSSTEIPLASARYYPPVKYQVQSHMDDRPLIQPSALQLQFRSIPVPRNPLLNHYQVQALPIITDTEIPIVSSLRYHPVGKVNIQQNVNGFNYTFKSHV